MTGILDGVRILDLGQVYAAPLCGQMLGDLGAEVIKVESLPAGEWGRRDSCPWAGGEASLVLECNRNKKSLGLNLREKDGRSVFYALLTRSDVVIHNFRPGVMERLGIGYQALAARNPRIIVGSISGYGESGPYQAKKGQDLLAQALSGAMWTNSFEGQGPLPIGNAVADHIAGQLLAYAIMGALYARERTGTGQQVSVSLLDAMVDLQLEPAFFYLNSGERYRRGAKGRGNPVGAGVPYGVYRTADARWLAISGSLSEVCQALGVDDLGKRQAFDTMEKQKAGRETLWDYLEEAVGRLTAAEATARLDGADVWNALVCDYDETFRHPQVLHNEMLIEVENPRGGTYRSTGIPVKFDRLPARPQRRPPRFAEHTAEILTWLGYGKDEIQELARREIVALENGAAS